MSVNYNIVDIAEITGGDKYFNNSLQEPVRNLLVDSRKLILPESSVFFAIKGERNDGHHFITELFHKGVTNFIVESLLPDFENLRANFIIVNDSLAALQK